MTKLDQTYAAMEAEADNDVARLRFFESLAAAELFLLLEGDGSETPRLFDTADGRFVLAFDTEDRLTAFSEGPAAYAALSGHAVARMIGTENVGIGLNLGVAPSSFLIPADAVAWLDQTLQGGPDTVTATPHSVAPPGALPEALLTSLDARLASAEGLARSAFLVSVTYDDGRHGHLLTFIDAKDEARPALARAISDAMAFSNIDAGELDVTFLAASDPAAAKLAKVGLRFDLPVPPEPSLPSNDPSKPPKLR